MQGRLYLIVLGSAIWTAVDASRLGARRGGLGGGMLDMGPAGWFFATLLLWIIAFPCYLATRPKLSRRAQGLAVLQQGNMAFPPTAPDTQMPFAGYGNAGQPAPTPYPPAPAPITVAAVITTVGLVPEPRWARHDVVGRHELDRPPNLTQLQALKH